jgi:hypothetical protein
MAAKFDSQAALRGKATGDLIPAAAVKSGRVGE